MQPRVLLVAALLALLASARKQLVGLGWGRGTGRYLPGGPLAGGLGMPGPDECLGRSHGSPEADRPHSAPLSSQKLPRQTMPPFWAKCRTT